MKLISSFEQYVRIYEAEGEKEGASMIFPLLMDVYYKTYASIVPYIGEYKDAIKDIREIGSVTVPLDKKPETAKKILDKVAGQVADDKLKGIITGKIIPAVDKVSEIYAKYLEKASEDEKKELLATIETKSNELVDQLISTVKEIKESSLFQEDVEMITEGQEERKARRAERKAGREEKKANKEAENAAEDEEKEANNKFGKQRAELVSIITPKLASLRAQIESPASASLGKELQKYEQELAAMATELGDNKKFADMKRKEKKDKIEQAANRIPEIDKEMDATIKNAMAKMGIDKKSLSDLNSINSEIASGMEELGSANAEKMSKELEEKKVKEESDKKAKEEAEGPSSELKAEIEKIKADFETSKLKSGDMMVKNFTEIKSGKEDPSNLSKKGNNKEKIKVVQERINKFKGENFDGINPDGLYGDNTEKAVKLISGALALINPEVKSEDGKTMTPLFRAMLYKFDKEGLFDKFKGILKKSEAGAAA
jgi:DNA repair exonuclease SbcCD ATPase subunit